MRYMMFFHMQREIILECCISKEGEITSVNSSILQLAMYASLDRLPESTIQILVELVKPILVSCINILYTPLIQK